MMILKQIGAIILGLIIGGGLKMLVEDFGKFLDELKRP